eukprot:g3427.t1
MSSWASIAATSTANAPTNTDAPSRATPRPFAFAAEAAKTKQPAGATPGAFSWASKVAGNKKPSPTCVGDIEGMASPTFSSASKLTRAAELKQIALDLESSRAGLNLAFKQAVTTSAAAAAAGASPATSASPAVSDAAASAEGSKKREKPKRIQPVQPITEAKMAKRQRQIDIGKATVGYKNYIHHVSKKKREFKNPRHPKTPKKEANISKRNFQGLIAAWRKQLHAWDDAGPFVIEEASKSASPPVAKVTPSGENAADTGAAVRLRRGSSWADMADSDSDDDDDDVADMLSGSRGAKSLAAAAAAAAAAATAPAKDTTRVKRKAEDELLPARHEKREKVNAGDSAVAEKPVSRALQLARQRAAAKKAAAGASSATAN